MESGYDAGMATIRISEAEAAGDFSALMAHVRLGAEVVIESGARVVAVVRPAAASGSGRLLSESLRLAKEKPSAVVLDGDFGRDLEAIVSSHSAALENPWG